MNSPLILIILVNVNILIGQEDDCSTVDCTNIDCLSSLTQINCNNGEYIVPNQNLCGCCPGCKGGHKVGEECFSDPNGCAPGLKCDLNSNLCEYDKSTCAYTYHLQDMKILPTCEIDGTFAAVQCKGDRVTGRCFCYSDNGKRIFGWSWWKDAKDMTCACSRLKFKLESEGQNENTLHCDQRGNFEPLQCTNGICWCANSTTGEMLRDTRAVPEAQWTFLPCYDMAKMGLKYLRQCESALYAQNVLRTTLFTHGTTKIEFNNIQCDYDGAFGIYSNLNGITSCQWRDGSKLGSFQVPSNLVSNMNCNCGRDQKIFAEAGLTHRLTCGGNGNYEPQQDINGKIFCVDSDGFAVSEAGTENVPDCKKYIYTEAKMILEQTEDYDVDDIENAYYQEL